MLRQPLLDRSLAVMVTSQRQAALQRCWRSSCHGLWKPSRKPGARLIQTLQFIDGRCCQQIDRRVEIACAHTAWKTVKQARRTLFRLVKAPAPRRTRKVQGCRQHGVTCSQCSFRRKRAFRSTPRDGRALPSVLINSDVQKRRLRLAGRDERSIATQMGRSFLFLELLRRCCKCPIAGQRAYHER